MAQPVAGPHAPVARAGKLALVSSFGLDHTQLGPEFPAIEIASSQRARELAFRAAYYECTQHDWKVFNWNGAPRTPEKFSTQPLIGGALPDFYVPLNQRRPETPYRLGRTIVGAFTALLFGHGRWPKVVSDDPETQDFAEALIEACHLKTKMIRARNAGGSCGTVGLSWGFDEHGQPKVRVHAAKHLYPMQWEDEDELVPAHVVELYQFPRDVRNPKTRKIERQFFWHRRDWTQTADIMFEPVPVTGENPVWQIDEKRSVQHNDGACHFVWVQNLPEDDPSSFDGQPDYAELYEQMDSVDVLNSTNVRGVVKNLDPTLKLRLNQEDVGSAVVQKGSDNALVVGLSGDASYLELNGTAAAAGHAAIETQRRQALETCQCIIPDPNVVAGAATSSVALKIVYAPMLSKGDIQRDQYGEAIVRVLDGMVQYARRLNVGGAVDEIVVTDDTGEEISRERVEYTLSLPPRIDKREKVDAAGEPTGEFDVTRVPRRPGSGTLTLEWPEYFRETADDRQKHVGALVQGVGSGQPVISQRTAVEMMAAVNQRNPQDEWARIQGEAQEKRANEALMFPGTGGLVEHTDDLPAGAEPMGEDADGRPDGAAEDRP